MILFPQKDLSDTEKQLVAEVLQNPVLQKYILLQANNIASSIVTATPAAEEDPEVWFRKELYLKGQLSILERFASIKPA